MHGAAPSGSITPVVAFSSCGGALQVSWSSKYHPDVCKEGNCGEQFHQIYEAYDFVMSHLRDVENDNVVGLNESKGDMYDVYDDWEDEMGGYEAGANYSSYYSPFYSYA
ncbi:Chaperone protein dnaJ 8- chloroplastic [Striga hermonthica]|uniref:Chaperone protein dnaJ 8- chloroplastic n=1 Tax=Striga hermonthica TaxID=68872 RepID=A0A9N7MPI4_STRHE|nr:Chaperone protein dnaJ 8- chloroplastic [Striga hermonthica]